MSIIIPNSDFDFSKLKLGNPSGIQGGAYFSKITMNDDQLLIQTPKSTTKNGITTTDKKNCVDFMFNVEQTTFSDWIEQFERKIKELIYQRRDAWFTNEMTMEDIDYFFTPMSRVYKTKFYLVRAFEQKNKMFRSERRYNFGLFGENGEETSGDELANENTQCISILEVQGLKFTSNSFRIEVSISQIMIVKEKKMNEQCMIKQVVVQEKPLVVQEKPLVVQDKPLVVQEKPLVVQEKPLVVQDKPLVVQEKPLVVQDKPLVVQEKPLVVQEKKQHSKILVEIQEVDIENPPEIQEVNIIPSALSDNDDPISLKQPNEVYYEIYREARKKATIAKNLAIKAYLEAKRIKNTYLLEDFDSDISSGEEDNIFEEI
uniref:Uncharacterized protein n=1 Tax=viral metagenome TaxID=1070528 RepID=A0A6C0BWH2_9ZZZZ